MTRRRPDRPPRPAALALDPRLVGLPGVAHGGGLAGRLLEEHDRPGLRLAFLDKLPAGARVDLGGEGDEVVVAHAGRPAVRGTLTSRSPELPAAGPVRAGAPLAGPARHPVPGCVACGTEHPDGLHLRLTAREDAPGVLGRWRPPPSWCAPDGTARTAGVGAVLDCAGFWAAAAASPGGEGTVVTAELDLGVAAVVPGGQEHAVTARVLARDRRLVRVEAVLHDAAGRPLARVEQALARAPWGFPLDAVRDQTLRPTRRAAAT